MEKKYIFLDIDGVLNCSTSDVDKSTGYIGIDDDKLAKLKTIVDKTNAEIILVSTWKEGWFPELSYKYLQDNLGNLIDKKFRKFGLKIIDKTFDNGHGRPQDILQYAFKHNIRNYVILDDQLFDYEDRRMMDNLVKTDEDYGLTDEKVEEAISKLNNYKEEGIPLSEVLRGKKLKISIVDEIENMGNDCVSLKCIGAIGGDIAGSQYEFVKADDSVSKLFDDKYCHFTDDTVMTVAIMDYFNNDKDQPLSYYFKKWFHKYPNAGFGGMFTSWCLSKDSKPYNSYGNGSAMRVSPVVYVAKSLDECLALAKETAEVTHNHPEGIKGAQAIAGCAYIAKFKKSKKDIANFAIKYYPELKKMIKYPEINTQVLREEYEFDETCQGSCYIAIYAFLTTNSYADMLNLINYIGGDTDTIGAMAGIIAECFYGINRLTQANIRQFLNEEMG